MPPNVGISVMTNCSLATPNQSDYRKAVLLLEKATTQGDARAQAGFIRVASPLDNDLNRIKSWMKKLYERH
jgi:hypothetical protein